MPIPQDDAPEGMSDRAAEEALFASLVPSNNNSDANDDDDEDEDDLDDTEEDDEDRDEDEDDDEAEDDADEDAEDEDDDAEDESAPEKPEEAKEAPAAAAAPADDAVVKVNIDGADKDFTVADLKRLATQEAVTTKRNAEAELVGGRAALMIQKAITAITEDMAEYEGIDWMSLATQMEPEEFQWHRETFLRQQKRLDDMVEEARGLETTMSERREAVRKDQITEAVKELQADIPEWNEQLYSEIMAYAVKEGLPEGDVSQIANAKIIKLLRKAMLHDKSQAAAAEKINLTPKRVKKGAAAERLADSAAASRRKLEKVVTSGRGTERDAIALLAKRLVG